jgi:hypothetical protein
MSRVFLGAVLQVIAVEAKKGGKGGKGKKGGGGGASTGGITVGVIAGVCAPNLTKLSALTTAYSGVVILAAMILKYRPYVMKFLRRSAPQDKSQPYANEISKDPDFERNAMGRHPPQYIPAYVSTFTFFDHPPHADLVG